DHDNFAQRPTPPMCPSFQAGLEGANTGARRAESCRARKLELRQGLDDDERVPFGSRSQDIGGTCPPTRLVTLARARGSSSRVAITLSVRRAHRMRASSASG